MGALTQINFSKHLECLNYSWKRSGPFKYRSMRHPTFFFFIFLGIFPFFLFAQKPIVVSTASIFADMAENIAGDAVEVEMIVPIGGDPHIYEPTPADVQLVEKTSLILMNGLTFEGWLNELIANSGTNARTVRITEGIEPIQSLAYKNSTDPHAWMDAQLGLTYIENIKNALVELLPSAKDKFEFNYGVYRQQLEDIDALIQNEIQKIPEDQRILITSHDAFRYYGNRYGIKVESVLGTSTDADIQTSDIIRLSKIIEEYNIPSVFIESTVNPKVLEQLASDKGIRIGGKLFSDSIGDSKSEAPTYLDMLKYNTRTIVKALTPGDIQTNSEEQEVTQEPDGNGSSYTLIGIIAVLLIGGLWIVSRNIQK